MPNEFSDSLNDALLNKDINGFWSTWRSKFSKSRPTRVIDGYCDENSIANRYADVFSAVCVPNSGVKHSELCEEFFALYAGYDQKLDINPNLSSELVGNCVAKLKRGKAAGLDGFTVEHVIFSNPVLLTHLNILYCLTLC